MRSSSPLSILVSIISFIIIVCLVSMQTYHFIVPVTRTTLTVESQMDKVIPSVLNISFLQLSCECLFFHFVSLQLSIFILIRRKRNLLQISLY